MEKWLPEYPKCSCPRPSGACGCACVVLLVRPGTALRPGLLAGSRAGHRAALGGDDGTGWESRAGHRAALGGGPGWETRPCGRCDSRRVR